MDRRAFLFSTAWLAVAPTPHLTAQDDPSGPSATAPAQDTVFGAWRAAFIEKATAQGLARDQVISALADVTPDPQVISLDQRQPEFSKPISSYISSTVSPGRVAQAQSHLSAARPWLDPIISRYEVPGELLVSIWAIESSFGQIQGDNDVIRSMATLAAEGRRRGFAEDELIGALRILISGEASRSQLTGSWAGAMGQMQFTPLDYLAYAVDGDGDGRRDIWTSSADALASAANFLVQKGHWRKGGATQIEVLVPASNFDYSAIEGPAKSYAEWADLGLRPADPHALVDPRAQDDSAVLLMPMGWQGPGFLTYPNHMAIRAYNNSTSYALAVGLLADRIAGAGPLVQAWPQDQPISLADRVAAQKSLQKLGFYTGGLDGLVGVDTRRAARLWQSSIGLPADGYLSFNLIQRLKAQAAPVSAPVVGAPPEASPPG